MHATMAIFNAWCDRVPMLVLGATGPVDAAKRRPWIDWIHTARDQGALVRDYTKWDDQPALGAARRSKRCCARVQIAATPPCAPVYVNLDAATAGSRSSAKAPRCRTSRASHRRRCFAPTPTHARGCRAAPASGEAPGDPDGPRVARRPSWARAWRSPKGLQRACLTDLKVAAAFPTDHPLHAAPPGAYLAAEATRHCATPTSSWRSTGSISPAH